MTALAPLGLSAAFALLVGAGPAVAAHGQDADRDRTTAAKADDTAKKSDNKVEDAWILTKVKTKFIGEKDLKGSDIDVDVNHGVVTLKGTVASEAGRERAVAIARDTGGVARVDDRLTINLAKNHDNAAGTSGRVAAAKADSDHVSRDTRESVHDTEAAAKDTAHNAKHSAEHTAHHAAHAAKGTTGTAGEAVTDDWITTKVKSSFVGVDKLDGSNIDVDTNGHVVTLNGTVPSASARAEAVHIAKGVKGVTKVNDKLRIESKDRK